MLLAFSSLMLPKKLVQEYGVKEPVRRAILESVPSATNFRLSPLLHELADFYDMSAPVDVILDSEAVSSTVGYYCICCRFWLQDKLMLIRFQRFVSFLLSISNLLVWVFL
ncbi:hypothetical protein R6Q59_035697 [Mikania micrantha]